MNDARLPAGKQRDAPTVRDPYLYVRGEFANIGGVRRRVARLDFNQMIQPEIVLRALEGRRNHPAQAVHPGERRVVGNQQLRLNRQRLLALERRAILLAELEIAVFAPLAQLFRLIENDYRLFEIVLRQCRIIQKHRQQRIRRVEIAPGLQRLEHGRIIARQRPRGHEFVVRGFLVVLGLL